MSQPIRNASPPGARLEIERTPNGFIYRWIDKDTGEVLGQWPPTAIVGLREHVSQLEGLLLDKKI